mgnify:CR=1 FL=1
MYLPQSQNVYQTRTVVLPNPNNGQPYFSQTHCCHYNLHGQWPIFHKAAVPIYERKYTNNEFMCTQCQHSFAQKTNIVIVRDRLLCVSCSENRGCDATINSSNIINMNTDTSSHNSLLSLKTKTTVTVTPISNGLLFPNLASLNYTETIKQLTENELNESC